MSVTMSKKQKRPTGMICTHEHIEATITETPQPTEPTIATGADIEPSVLKPRRYVPPSCSLCTALRPKGQDFTSVYATKQIGTYIIRHCKCGFCGNTFKDSQEV
jgi:hypothetical protein